MIYSAGNLCTLANVLMAETGWSKTHLSKLITGQPNTIARLMANPDTTYNETLLKLSDWVDENWPLHVPWPHDVEQRRSGRLGREERLDDALNERGRKLKRYDERMREFVELREELVEDDQARLREITNGHRDKTARMSAILRDLQSIIVSPSDGDEAPAAAAEASADTRLDRGRRRNKERVAEAA